MTREMVNRLDSARMSALFSEALKNSDDEFLSPRTELSIEDVRRLRLNPVEKPREEKAGSKPPLRATPPNLPRPGAHAGAHAGAHGIARRAVSTPVKPSSPTNFSSVYGVDLLGRDSGDAESWLVASPSAGGERDEIRDFFMSRGDDASTTSLSQPSDATGDPDAKSSLGSDPPPSPELRLAGNGRTTPLSRIPRNHVLGNNTALPGRNGAQQALRSSETPNPISYQENISPTIEDKIRGLSTTNSTLPPQKKPVSKSYLSPLALLSNSSDRRSVFGGSRSIFGIRRASSVASSVADLSETDGEPSSPRSDIVIMSQSAAETPKKSPLIFRRKSLRFKTKEACTSKLPFLRRKKSGTEGN